tara:strand:+ start:3165 stop:3479 length:315 start_codon:yes stop_codon:yes gene_type:complete
MLINEVIAEDQNNILNDLEELITRAKANGKFKIPTNMVLAKLRAMGHSISIQDLLDLLPTITSVGASNKKDISLDTAIPRSNAEPDSDVVSKLAKKQMQKDDEL